MTPPGQAWRDPLAPPPPRAAIHGTRVMRNRAHIVAVRTLTHDLRELVVRCVPGSAALGARAGQFATLTVDGLSGPRSYSFARDPHAEDSDAHTFLVRLVPDGEFSQWLAAADRTGAAVTLSGPLGGFTLDDGREPMLLVGGGSGMSALRALAEAASRAGPGRDCVFLYGARTRADRNSLDLIERIGAQWPRGHRFEFVEVLSEEPAASDWHGARGLVTDELGRRLERDDALPPQRLRAWLCGPPPMIAAAAEALAGAGVPGAHVFRDAFEDLRSPAPVIDNRRCVLCDECLLVRPVEGCIVEAGSVRAGADGTPAEYAPLVPGATAGLYYNALVIDAGRCIRCQACINACPHGAISVDAPRRAETLRSYRPG